MSRPGSTKGDNAYGRTHRANRKRAVAAALGTWCPVGRPGCDGLMVDASRMHFDHSEPVVLGGRQADRVVCSHCNCSAGATLGNRLRGARRRGTRVVGVVSSRSW